MHVTRVGACGSRVIFVHGGVQETDGASAISDGQLVLARRGLQLEVVDRPGFGQTASRGVGDQEADARWIAAMLNKGAHLVGHSWGGPASLLAASYRPQTVRSLTLIEPALHCLLADASLPLRDPAALAELAAVADLLLISETLAD